MVNFAHKPLDYDEEYFTGDYRKQYGRTYAEDEPAISALARRRLDRMLEVWRPGQEAGGLSLLDIGSALGFFLDAARLRGFSPVRGIEISHYAAKYTKDRFGIKVFNTTFEAFRPTEKYHAVTAWYFIEHCEDPLAAIKKIYSLLVEGGVFAFSTPSKYGPLYVFNRDEWIRVHPPDHKIDFSPRSVRIALQRAGFSMVQVDAAGIHPERILPSDSFFYKPFSHAYQGISRLMRFSDTIEVYAVK